MMVCIMFMVFRLIVVTFIMWVNVGYFKPLGNMQKKKVKNVQILVGLGMSHHGCTSYL